MGRICRVCLVFGVTGASVALGLFIHALDPDRASDAVERPARVADAAGEPRTSRTARPGRSVEAKVRPPTTFKQIPTTTHEPHEVLVATAPKDFPTRAGAVGYRVVETLRLRQLELMVHRVRLPAGTDVASGQAHLRSQFPRALVDADHHYGTSLGISVGTLPASVARSVIGWNDLPEDCGQGLRLGMIDAGVDVRHAALTKTRIHYRAFNRTGRGPGSAEHGTAVAAMLAGSAKTGQGWGGLVPAATLFAANIFEVTETGRTVATARGLLSAVDWIAANRVHALNLSLAGPDNRIVKRAIGRAVRRGVVPVAAAGNWGSNTRRAFPAAYPEVIAVTAVAANGRIYSHANSGPWIDFAAPGVRLWTAVPEGGRFQSGTSFASPFVAVRAAAAVASGLNTGVDAIRSHLRNGAVDLGRPGRDTVFGWGLLSTPPACTVAAGPSLGGTRAR